MESVFEKLGGTYRWERDYLIPNLNLPAQEEQPLGKYGRMRRNYSKVHHPACYSRLVLEGQLWNHLAEINKLCNARMEVVMDAMKKQEGVTEALKAADQMEWVRHMNSIHNRAEEIVLRELVYEG